MTLYKGNYNNYLLIFSSSDDLPNNMFILLQSKGGLSVVFYGPQGHPYDCFPTGSMYVYIYIYFLVSTYASMRCISLVPRLSRPTAKNSLVTWANIPGAVTFIIEKNEITNQISTININHVINS